MKIGSFNSLTEMVRKTDFTPQATDELREAGLKVVDQAILTFFDPRREIDQAQTSVQDLMDLQSAVEAMADKTDHARTANLKKAQQHLSEIPAQPAHEEKLENAQSLPNYYGRTFTIKDGKRVFSKEQLSVNAPENDRMDGLHAFAEAMHSVLPLYTCVAMVPGPLSVSVKNFAKEVYQNRQESSSWSQTQTHSESLAGSLLLLGAKGSESNSSSSSASQTTSNTQASLTSVDERVMPGMFEVRERLNQMKFVPAREGQITGSAGAHDVYQADGQTKNGERSQTLSREVEKFAYEPAHLWMPNSSISNYEYDKRGY